MEVKQKRKKLKGKQKLMLAMFMECVPVLLDIWKEKAPEQSLDCWLIETYNEGKRSQKKFKKEVCK